MTKEKDILIIIGPTAIGKSALAIEKAQDLGAEIISADAFQVYKYMDIGTAKVSKDIRNQIPHHLIDIKEPQENYSVAEFMNLTKNIINDLRAKNKPIIICGGTIFYIYAFLYNYQFNKEKSDPEYRQKLEKTAKEYNSEYLWNKLNKIDPKAANNIHPNNTKKIIRQLEIYYQYNKLPSKIRIKSKKPRADVSIIGLKTEREKLYTLINKRVDLMIEQGLIEEVRHLLNKYPDNSQAFEAVGYKETIQYLKGSITKEEMIELIKQKSRNFAKRQLTWLKNFENVKWIHSS
jgi:tRNA dimethylallyltransferase